MVRRRKRLPTLFSLRHLKTSYVMVRRIGLNNVAKVSDGFKNILCYGSARQEVFATHGKI